MSITDPISSNAHAGIEDYSFPFLRFLVAPSHDQIQSLSGSSSFFGPAPYDLSPSFDFFALAVPQAGAARIAFASNRDGQVQIYTMNADGTSQSRLTNSGGNDDAPRWSPSGAKIIFQSDRDDTANGTNDIYVMNADGAGQTRLTSAPGDDCAPAWSPDGSKIVFQSLRNGQFYQLYSMNADGSGQVNLSDSGGSDRQPSWSPNGSKIAFASERDHAGYASIYVMNANGTGQTRLTFGADSVTDEQPVWSRDGRRIAFVSTRDGDKEVYVMNADGTSQTRLTNDPGNNDSPFWSPDGSKIVFRSDRVRDCCDPTSQVWVMNADGTGPVNLSGSQYGDYSASWTLGGGNQPPVADAGGSYTGITAQTTAFSGSGSFDPDGSVASYSWSFGDGGSGSGASPTHAYASQGTYTVTLTVTDNSGAQASNSTTVNISSSSSDQFVQNFLQWGLARQPGGDEGSYWGDILRAAYPKGQTSMLLAMREFGMTVFESAEYAARGRSDHWYVYDLYKTYLMRDPDPSGWAWWESRVPAMGREQLRHTFDESIEFGQIVATLTASGPPSSAASSLATARVDLFNQPGNQIRARDCEWGISLLSLPGRAGLDLGLGLSYSSLVWTRSGPYAYFDEDRSSPSPGFQLGFATIRGPFFDAQVAKNVYVLVTSSGRRVALRQVGTSNSYEAADSSYLQLTAGGGGLLLRSTDGTQVNYSPSNNGWRATLIQDRNGNYLSVNYDWRGDIANVTDTLGRVITFNYDSNSNLSTITQTWLVNGVQQTHTWASFGWDLKVLQPGFSAAAAVGAYSGEAIPVLVQVGLDVGSRYVFEYNGSGQVRAIRRFTSDNIERSRMTYIYATLADDCPRLIAVNTSADNWTSVNGLPWQVVTQFGVEGDGSHSMTAPDGTVYKDTYGAGWQRGLVVQSEVTAEGRQQRLAVTQWTQDDTTVGYQTNPRVTETNVYDFPPEGPSNRRRTTIDYGPYAQYGLPYTVTEYDDGVTPLRQTYTDYNLSQTYLDRRIIGLVSATHVYDPVASKLLAKTTYAYDEEGTVSTQATAAPGHDQSFIHTFLTRGNLTSASRWDAEHITDDTKALTSHVTYDAAGSVLTSTDPAGHQTSAAYADSFSDGNNSRGTFAYPTSLTDADSFSSSIQYNFDFGARTRFEGPPPENQPNGIIQTFAYDGTARVERVTTVNNGAYTRYAYGPNYVAAWATVNTAANEAYTNTVFDGLGRVILVAGNNPSSTSGYKAKETRYDLMGRADKQSNPAEVGADWSPAGPDDGAGWLYTQQTYDWKGRPRITTNTDGTQRSASYEGCGCAGGEVVTLTDEEGRQQKVYSDALGRSRRTEVLNEYGTVYSTATTKYDALDRAVRMREYVGEVPPPQSEPEGEGSGYQTKTMAYDGYGRLRSRHTPEQNAGASTVYTYNSDDTPDTMTDGRGAVATYSYDNDRHLVSGITYTLSGSATVTHTYTYDAAGNRTSMTDGPGSGVTYHYNSLSRLTSETRSISGLASPQTIGYDYNLAGGLKTLSYSNGATISYGFDGAGQVRTVSGSPQEYVTDIKYRAWGEPGKITYGNDFLLDLSYDSRLRLKRYYLQTAAFQGQRYDAALVDQQYYADGNKRYSHDMLDERFDRAYDFDHIGRLTEVYSGADARTHVDQPSSPAWGPLRQSYQYNVWGDLTSRSSWFWSQSDSFTATYVNGRNQSQSPLWQYDADGNLRFDKDFEYKYDAMGRNISTLSLADNITAAQTLDADGEMVKRTQSVGGSNPFKTTYYVRSTVLGGKILTELINNGVWSKNYVYLGGEVLAVQETNNTYWRHDNPLTGGRGGSGTGGSFARLVEPDPMGVDVGLEDPAAVPQPTPQELDIASLAPGGPAGQCRVEGILFDCVQAYRMLSQGTATRCPNDDCGPQRMDIPGFGPALTQPFQAWADGSYGYLAVGLTREDYDDLLDGLADSMGGASSNRLTAYAMFFAGRTDKRPRKRRRRRVEQTVEQRPASPPTQITVPIGGIDKLRSMLQATLVYNDCKNAMSDLIKKIEEMTGRKAVHTDVMDLFNMMTSQTDGGGIYMDFIRPEMNKYIPARAAENPQEPAGGSGLSWTFNAGPRMHTGAIPVEHHRRITTIFLKGAYSDSQQSAFDRIPYDYMVTTIHELAHQAAADVLKLYGEGELDAAARQFGTKGIDDYIARHCLPPQYQYR